MYLDNTIKFKIVVEIDISYNKLAYKLVIKNFFPRTNKNFNFD